MSADIDRDNRHQRQRRDQRFHESQTDRRQRPQILKRLSLIHILGHYPKADAYLKEALEKGYDTPWFHTVLAYHYWKTGKREEALKWLNKAKDEGRHPDWMDQAFKELEKPKGFKLFKGK